MRYGATPVGSTMPAVYLCGSCRVAEVAKTTGICSTCDAILTFRESCASDSVWHILGRIAFVLGLLGITVLGFYAAAQVGK